MESLCATSLPLPSPGAKLFLLAGLGGSAHAFDQFVPKLTAKYHVLEAPPPRVQNGSPISITALGFDRACEDSGITPL